VCPRCPGGTFAFADRYVLHDLKDRRGRSPDEVPRLLDAVDGIHEGLRDTARGGRLVIIADVVEEVLAELRSVLVSIDKTTAFTCWAPGAPVTRSHSPAHFSGFSSNPQRAHPTPPYRLRGRRSRCRIAPGF
jgi:hypothetical protein